MKIKGRFRERDTRVILHVGYHRQLTRDQIGILEFPYHGNKPNIKYSYNTCQRRIREFYIKNNILSEPIYVDLDGKGSNDPVYTLAVEGKALFELRTGLKPKTNTISLKYTPHLIEANNLLILLKRTGWLGIGNFELESKVGNKLVDVMIDIRGKKIAIEVDLSEKDWKQQIQKQFKSYENAIQTSRTPDNFKGIIYYSNRYRKLQKWVSEVSKGYLSPCFVPRKPKVVLKAIKDMIK